MRDLEAMRLSWDLTLLSVSEMKQEVGRQDLNHGLGAEAWKELVVTIQPSPTLLRLRVPEERSSSEEPGTIVLPL